MVDYLVIEITNKCELACKYCYISKGNKHMSKKMLRDVLERFEPEFVSISGGEPLLHPHFWELVDTVSDYCEFEVLTSGVEIENPERFKGMNVQVTVDGEKEYHNRVRGHYRETVENAKKLAKYADVTVVTVLTEENWKEIPAVLELSEGIGATTYRVIRMIPVRRELREMMVSKKHALEVAKYLYFARKGSSLKVLSYWLDCLLQYHTSGEHRGKCSGGEEKLTITPHGRILPCEFLRDPNYRPRKVLGCPAMAYYTGEPADPHFRFRDF